MRKQGFYWVNYSGNWEVAEYYFSVDSIDGEGSWLRTGSESTYVDCEFDAINENVIIKP